jgi:hypothetical protein
MASFRGGMREVADHKRPWVRLDVDTEGARLGPWFPLVRRMPSYVFSWSQVERIEPLTDRYLSGPGIRFVMREPVPALQGGPNAAQWPPARQPIFLCSNDSNLRAVLAALPASLIVRDTPAPPAPPAQRQPTASA